MREGEGQRVRRWRFLLKDNYNKSLDMRDFLVEEAGVINDTGNKA